MGTGLSSRAPGKRCFYSSVQLKNEDEAWTSAEPSEDEGDFAPDKQVSFTVQQQMSRRDNCSFQFHCKYLLKGCITVTTNERLSDKPDIYILFTFL